MTNVENVKNRLCSKEFLIVVFLAASALTSIAIIYYYGGLLAIEHIKNTPKIQYVNLLILYGTLLILFALLFNTEKPNKILRVFLGLLFFLNVIAFITKDVFSIEIATKITLIYMILFAIFSIIYCSCNSYDFIKNKAHDY